MSIVNASEHENNLVAAAYHREIEVYNYQVNIDNYTAMLATLPSGEWPPTLLPYRGTAVDALPYDLSDSEVTTISTYQHRDRLRALLRTERVEQGKSIMIRDALKAQIGANYDALVAAKKAEIASAG